MDADANLIIDAGKARIGFEPITSDAEKDVFVFTYADAVFSIRLQLSTAGGEPLTRLFDEMANHWQGWHGDKFWANDALDLKLTARCTSRGLVTLRIEAGRPGPGASQFTTDIALEPGQIARAAARLRQMFAHRTMPYATIYGIPDRRSIATIAIVVDDYDRAIAFYRDVLGFWLRSDRDLGDGKRWVTMAPDNDRGVELLLAKAVGERQNAAVGNQSGGRVFLFLETDDFARDHAAFIARGVRFTEEPRNEPYGTVAVFEDLYGNRWDLIEPA